MTSMVSEKIVLLVLTLLLALGTAQQPPPNYSYDALPETSFSCRGRVVGGYYADVEAGCQMFHVCGTSERTSFRFLCPNNTVFDQQHLICANWFQVSCDRSTVLYSRNFEIFKKDSEKELEFNTLDEEDLPALADYDFDYQLSPSSGPGRFVNSNDRGSSRSDFAVPVTRQPATRAPRRFDLTTAATTPRPVVSSQSTSFRDQSTFASTGRPAGRPRPAPVSRGRQAPARLTAGEGRDTSPRPIAATAASASAGMSFSTPSPVFTTTGRFPFGFTSVPQTNIAFGGGGGSFSFGTDVTSRPAPSVPPTAGAPASPATASSAVRQLIEATNDATGRGVSAGGSQRQFDRSRGRGGVSVVTTPRPLSARTLLPTTPVPSRAAPVSPASPFVRGSAGSPVESQRTVSPVASSFFGANVVPGTAAAAVRPRADSSQPSGPSSVRDASVNDAVVNVNDDASNNEIDGGRVGVTTTPAGGRFSATVPTRTASTRLSAGAATTARPRTSGGGRANFRRRRPPLSAATSGSAGAAVTRRRGSSRRGGSRAGTSASPVARRVSAAPVVSLAIPSVAPAAAGARPSRRPAASRGSRRPVVARPVSRPTAVPLNTLPPAEITNEIDAAPTPKPTRRPRPGSRGRGNRRFDPRRPGGELNPIRYLRNRGGRGRPAPVTISPTTAPPPRRRIISDIADVEALTDELNLLDERELLEELEREDRRFRGGSEANNRSIDNGSRRQRLPTIRGTTPAPLPAPRVIASTRPAPRWPTPLSTAADPAPQPQVIRKRIRVRGRPSRRPRVGTSAARGTITSRPRPIITSTTTTAATTTTIATIRPPQPAVTTASPPTAEASTLPTNKEASNVGRQSGGFFLRPKLQLSSALPTDQQIRRLNDVNALAAERTGRSRNTSPIAFTRAGHSTTRAPDARLSEILFASSSPGGARRGDSDYDYQYYDSEFQLEHQDLIEDADDLFQPLRRKVRWT